MLAVGCVGLSSMVAGYAVFYKEWAIFGQCCFGIATSFFVALYVYARR